MGRPKKLTQARKELFLERLEQSPYLTVCARSQGVEVSPSTIRNAMAGDPDFGEAVRIARLTALDRMAHALHVEAMKSGSFEQRLRYLQSTHPAFKKQELDVNFKTKKKGQRAFKQ